MIARNKFRLKSLAALGASLALFTAGFALADRFQLTHGVLYRLAANDLTSAAGGMLWLGLQALSLFAAIVLLSRKIFGLIMLLACVSIFVNLAYGQILNEVIDPSKIAWLIAESRRGGDAAAEFSRPLAVATLQTIIAIGFFIATRRVFRLVSSLPRNALATTAGVVLLALPSILTMFVNLGPDAAERNIFSGSIAIALAEPPPQRPPVERIPSLAGSPRHIVWLVDESVAQVPFDRLIGPELEHVQHVDFGVSASLSHCSAPSNLALRSGVEVRKAGPHMDLRTTPSIWGYARRAGYRTIHIDGQTSGAPQNLLLPPEILLIDDLITTDGGIDTDHQIARDLNKQLRGSERTFTYVVLRGVHFQYSDHYPLGFISESSSVVDHYDAALMYSKTGFFDTLFSKVDRENVAVIYTSDHGQNFEEGTLPHCSREAVTNEFLVPLLAFLPNHLSTRYRGDRHFVRSASQIFPATLIWMGYDSDFVQNTYDRDLSAPTVKHIRFERNVIPVSSNDEIGIQLDVDIPMQSYDN